MQEAIGKECSDLNRSLTATDPRSSGASLFVLFIAGVVARGLPPPVFFPQLPVVQQRSNILRTVRSLTAVSRLICEELSPAA